jgi:uncharacterized Zn-finger protein
MKNLLERIGLKKPTIQEKNRGVVNISQNLFVCHYCKKPFELDNRKIFPMSVPAIGKDYMYPAQGITCPYCFKDCICN